MYIIMKYNCMPNFSHVYDIDKLFILFVFFSNHSVYLDSCLCSVYGIGIGWIHWWCCVILSQTRRALSCYCLWNRLSLLGWFRPVPSLPCSDCIVLSQVCSLPLTFALDIFVVHITGTFCFSKFD